MLVVHLPDGPTAHFRLSNLKLSEDIPNCGRATSHKPELILNNFNTRIGHRIGRLFASLFCQDPTFRGRRAVTFHNQRDFIFFRSEPPATSSCAHTHTYILMSLGGGGGGECGKASVLSSVLVHQRVGLNRSMAWGFNLGTASFCH